MATARSGPPCRCGAGRTWSGRLRVAAIGCRRAEIRGQRGRRARRCRQGGVHARADDQFRAGDDLAWAVIPMNEGWVLSDINVAILFVFAISSLEVYGVIMGGWASNSKVPLPGLAPLCRADDLLRGLHRPHHHRRYHLDREHEFRRYRRRTGRPLWLLQLVLAAAFPDGLPVLHLGAGRDQPAAL